MNSTLYLLITPFFIFDEYIFIKNSVLSVNLMIPPQETEVGTSELYHSLEVFISSILSGAIIKFTIQRQIYDKKFLHDFVQMLKL